MGVSERSDRLERAEARLEQAEAAIDDLRRVVVTAERTEAAVERTRGGLRVAGLLALAVAAVVVLLVSRGRH